MGNIISLKDQKIKKACGENLLNTLFQRHAVVLAGDELGAFYLDKWACWGDEDRPMTGDEIDSPFYLWNRRDQYRTNVSYMELVYAAHSQGIRHIAIDMDITIQPGINEGLRLYRRRAVEEGEESVYATLLESKLTAPMDSVVQMAGSLGMRVHAVNCGLTGIATMFRVSKGILTVPEKASYEEKMEAYMKEGFSTDNRTLMWLLRRQPRPSEQRTMKGQMLLRLGEKKDKTEEYAFCEDRTVQMIQEKIGEERFLGFFQNERIFSSAADLEGALRKIYGASNIARLAMTERDLSTFRKMPHYRFSYAPKGCAITMTEAYAAKQASRKRRPGGAEGPKR